MKKYLIGVWAIIGFACGSNSNTSSALQATDFLPQNNLSVLDQACKPLIAHYLEMQKGLVMGDTAYFFNNNLELLVITDSLANLNSTEDTVLLQHFRTQLQNIHAEADALLALRSNAVEAMVSNELNMSFHMLSLQLITMMGQIGYSAQNLYLFTVADEDFEDGFKWMSWQKKSRDPYHPKIKEMLTADQLLQHP